MAREKEVPLAVLQEFLLYFSSDPLQTTCATVCCDQTVAQKHTSSDHLWFRPCIAPSRLEQGYSTVPAGRGQGETHGKGDKTYGSHDDIIGL
jgi:hypothetical protein